MTAGDILHLVGGLKPSRHAAKFIATADQAIVIDAFAVTREAAADPVGTFTAWINLPDITGNYSIISIGDTAAIEFITMRVFQGKLTGECNAATAIQWEHRSKDVVITPHKWHHVAMVQDASTSPVKLYVDGELVAMTVVDETANESWILACGLLDNGSIGAAEEAGAAAQIRECKGAISDVKYWKVALTDEEVKEDYRGKDPTTIHITAGTSDLTNWWNMKDDYVDSVAAENGTAGASIKLVSQYSQFTSRMAFAGMVIADDFSVSVNRQEGHCVVIKAA